jgi:hypothetical protein
VIEYTDTTIEVVEEEVTTMLTSYGLSTTDIVGKA